MPGQTLRPTDQEHTFVSWLVHSVDKDCLPDEVTFQLNAARSLNVQKQKFAELKDVGHGEFRDLIVQVVKEPYDLGDKVTIWVSDYTENSEFFHHMPQQAELYDRDDDPLGYTAKFSTGTGQVGWPGPYGKRAMQMTAWEPHDQYIRDEVKMGDWVHLANVQIKCGHNGSNLEGFLRGGEGFGRQARIQVSLMDPKEATENVDPRLKAALRRRRDYEVQLKKQKKGLKADLAASKKRKAVEEPKEQVPNAKSRREQKRAKKKAIAQAQEATQEIVSDLNERGRCPSTPAKR